MHIPRHLFKYRNFSIYSLASLSAGKVWVPVAMDFNDPFDCPAAFFTIGRKKHGHPRPIYNDRIDDVLMGSKINRRRSGNMTSRAGIDRIYMDGGRIVRPHIGTEYESLNKSQKKLISEMGIYSMSAKNDDVLMWSHYGDNHRGFCLEFEILEKKDNDSESCIQINYEESKLSPLEENIDNESLRRRVAGYKANQWSYEAEYRLIYKEGRREYTEPYRLSGVIFGIEANSDHCRMLKSILADRKGLRFYKVVQTKNLYRLKIVPYL